LWTGDVSGLRTVCDPNDALPPSVELAGGSKDSGDFR
jgi:hypothetical protein